MIDKWDYVQDKIREHAPSDSWVEGVYSKLIDDLSFEVRAFLGASHNTTYGDAIRTMSREELETFKRRLRGISEYRWRKFSHRVRMTRLEGLQEICVAYVFKIASMEEARLHDELTIHFEKVRRLALWSLDVEHDDEDVDYEAMFDAKWFGKSFHLRAWWGNNLLVFNLRQTLAKCLAMGYGYKRIVRDIACDVARAKHTFLRFLKTETFHFANLIIKREYELHDVKEYVFNSSPNERQCVICKGLDKCKFKVSEILVGANYPTMHPRCDCLTRPSLYLPSERPFEEWEQLVFGK